MHNRVETIKRQTRVAYGCLVAGQSSWAPALSVTRKRRYSCGMRLMALYKCYMPLHSSFAWRGEKRLTRQHGGWE